MLRRTLFLGALASVATSAVGVSLPAGGVDRLIGGTQSPQDRLAWIEAELKRLEAPLRRAQNISPRELLEAVPKNELVDAVLTGGHHSLEVRRNQVDFESRKLSLSPIYQGLIRESQSLRSALSRDAFGGQQAIRSYLRTGIAFQKHTAGTPTLPR